MKLILFLVTFIITGLAQATAAPRAIPKCSDCHIDHIDVIGKFIITAVELALLTCFLAIGVDYYPTSRIMLKGKAAV
jgi:hypothetical protein